MDTPVFYTGGYFIDGYLLAVLLSSPTVLYLLHVLAQ